MIINKRRHTGLKFSLKRTSNEELNETARNMGRARRMHRGQGDEKKHDTTTWDQQGTGLPVEARRGGGGVGMRMVNSEREKKGPLDGITMDPTGT